jgi:hypothetical protein
VLSHVLAELPEHLGSKSEGLLIHRLDEEELILRLIINRFNEFIFVHPHDLADLLANLCIYDTI